MADITNMFKGTSIEMLRSLREILKMFPRKYIGTPECVSRWEFACNVQTPNVSTSRRSSEGCLATQIHIHYYICLYSTNTSQRVSRQYFV